MQCAAVGVVVRCVRAVTVCVLYWCVYCAMDQYVTCSRVCGQHHAHYMSDTVCLLSYSPMVYPPIRVLYVPPPPPPPPLTKGIEFAELQLGESTTTEELICALAEHNSDPMVRRESEGRDKRSGKTMYTDGIGFRTFDIRIYLQCWHPASL